jgi:hypothetical protein
VRLAIEWTHDQHAVGPVKQQRTRIHEQTVGDQRRSATRSFARCGRDCPRDRSG